MLTSGNLSAEGGASDRTSGSQITHHPFGPSFWNCESSFHLVSMKPLCMVFVVFFEFNFLCDVGFDLMALMH